MTSRQRKSVLFMLLIPLIGVLFLGLGIGTVELLIWVALLAAWLVAFRTWASRGPDPA